MTIALCIKTKVDRELKKMGVSRCKIDVLVQEGKHNTKSEIDKQVNDKERVLAALENPHIADAIEDLIKERNFY